MKRRLLIGAIVLFAAAVVNVAVAWLLAAVVPVPMYPRTLARAWIGSDGRLWTTAEVSLLGIADVWWDAADNSFPGLPLDEQMAALSEMHDRLARKRDDFRALLAPPGFGSLVSGTSPEPDSIGSDTAYGLPLPCLWYTVRSSYQANTIFNDRLEGAFLIAGAPSARGRDFRALPLRPLWPGFALNMLAFAALIWLSIRGAPLARRLLRVHRGLCPSCAYRIGDSAVCTECGKALPNRAVA